MTCRDCIEEGTATGGPCTEPRHQAQPIREVGVTALERECARLADRVYDAFPAAEWPQDEWCPEPEAAP